MTRFSIFMRRSLEAKMHKLKLLTDSRIGTIHKCECCDDFHLTLGNASVRLTHNRMLALTQLVFQSLEVDLSDAGFPLKMKSRVN